jgi:hypothetical protein
VVSLCCESCSIRTSVGLCLWENGESTRAANRFDSIRINYSAWCCSLACNKRMGLKGRRGKREKRTVKYILMFNDNEKH